MDRNKRDAIVREYRGDFPSSSFIPWIKVSEISNDKLLKRTSVYFVDWFENLREITSNTPFGGLALNCNWYSKYRYFTDLYSSEFQLNGELNNTPNKAISSIKFFKSKKYLCDFDNQLELMEWGLITKSNLLVSFISHKDYTSCVSNKPNTFYDEISAKAEYQVRMLFSNTSDLSINLYTSLYKHFSNELLVFSSYSLTKVQMESPYV
ncbi:hypothetical protein [Terribacillus halophilus]|uniref:hypothetical protein n=1 Tax=Terribacillus halophilus TaxID=361279 RepID=UPI000986D2EA|nr:hypothetical protein [Terribacillus halophilus]